MSSKVIVAGSVNQDIVATVQRHPKVGETVFGKELLHFPGGKGANQAVASAKSGSPTVMIGAVGKDASGAELTDFLKNQGVVTLFKEVEGVSTGTALIVVSEDSNNSIVVIPGANNQVDSNDVARAQFSSGDVLLSQFEIPENAIKEFFELGKKSGCVTILNLAPAKECSNNLLDLTDILVANETELEFYSGRSVDISSDQSIQQAAMEFRTRDNQIVVVTIGEHGVVYVLGDEIARVAGLKVEAIDTTGAGDCFCGYLASGLAGASIEQLQDKSTLRTAIVRANLAASICVTRQGAGSSMPSAEELK